MSGTTNIPDWLAALGLVVPALTGLLGYLLAGRNEEARDGRAAERERVAREAVRDERREDERHYFQRDTLLELQDVLRREMRAAARIVQHDQATLKSQGSFTQLPAELSSESYDVGIAVTRLYVRVLADELRSAVGDFHGFVAGLDTAVILLHDLAPEEATARLDAQMKELASRYIALNDILGEHLRTELGR